ncbi:hypothetical protein CA51_06650 [Rosistilla oblonga]|nr:hypothetical protein CA51_06650 [Rosistilla oblonga]
MCEREVERLAAASRMNRSGKTIGLFRLQTLAKKALLPKAWQQGSREFCSPSTYGSRTLSITWMTPLLVTMSVAMTFD